MHVCTDHITQHTRTIKFSWKFRRFLRRRGMIHHGLGELYKMKFLVTNCLHAPFTLRDTGKFDSSRDYHHHMIPIMGNL